MKPAGLANAPWTVSAALVCALAAGCSSHLAPSSRGAARAQSAAPAYPARPVVAPPAFKVIHHDASSFTLVTREDATDEDVESLVWRLHDAARTRGFAALKLDQKSIDKRDPIVWFHIYRGATCASEKYTTGKLPCGDSYHASGDYTLGGFTNPKRDDGVLRHADGHEVHLWNPDAGG